MKKLPVNSVQKRIDEKFGEGRYTLISYKGDKEVAVLKYNTCGDLITKNNAGHLIYDDYINYICRPCDSMLRQKKRLLMIKLNHLKLKTLFS